MWGGSKVPWPCKGTRSPCGQVSMYVQYSTGHQIEVRHSYSNQSCGHLVI